MNMHWCPSCKTNKSGEIYTVAIEPYNIHVDICEGCFLKHPVKIVSDRIDVNYELGDRNGGANGTVDNASDCDVASK